jgi:hypothetical protein
MIYGAFIVAYCKVPRLIGVMPKNSALFQSRLEPVMRWAKALKDVADKSVLPDSCPRVHVVNVVSLRYLPFN